MANLSVSDFEGHDVQAFEMHQRVYKMASEHFPEIEGMNAGQSHSFINNAVSLSDFKREYLEQLTAAFDGIYKHWYNY